MSESDIRCGIMTGDCASAELRQPVTQPYPRVAYARNTTAMSGGPPIEPPQPHRTERDADPQRYGLEYGLASASDFRGAACTHLDARDSSPWAVSAFKREDSMRLLTCEDSRERLRINVGACEDDTSDQTSNAGALL